MNAKDYIFQDVRWHYEGHGVVKFFYRWFFNSAYKFCILFRFSQRHSWGGYFYRYYCNQMSISMPFNTKIGQGVLFDHGFPLVINGGSVIGKFVIINPDVLIGGNRKNGKSPVIGNFCYIGNGVKIIGDAKIGDWCFLAPGAVVTKDVPEGTVVGCGHNNFISRNGRERCWEYLSEKVRNKCIEDAKDNRH